MTGQLNLQEALLIQKHHLDLWRAVLTDDAYNELERITALQTVDVLAKKQIVPMDIPRGVHLDSIVANMRYKRGEQCKTAH